jgi:ligand-binding sensor domain-containing protein/DNA-binding CsgD family transcriptional regulator
LIVNFFRQDVYSQQPIGQTQVTNYSKLQYGGGTQNWALAQDDNGRMYIANNEGLLVFDGTNWQLYAVPNKTILRSITFAPDGKLYAGAQDELGHYSPDGNGSLRFTSLKNLLPAPERNFADVWDVEAADTAVFFRTNNNIYVLSGNRFNVYRPISTWLSLFKHNGQIIAHDKQIGLRFFQNGQWQTFIEKSRLPADFVITDVIHYRNDTSLVASTKNGLFFLVQNTLIPFTLKDKLNPQHYTSLTLLNDNSFLAGTYSNGLYQITLKGDVQENIDSKAGLQNNTVRCLYSDKSGNVWTGHDNGIDFLAYSNAIKHVNPPSFNNGSGYCVKVLNGDLYFALSTGLEWLPIASATDLTDIDDVPNSILSGQTWNLSIINNQLLAGRDDGFWKINNYRPELISSSPGYWTYEPVPNTLPATIAAGNYLGIHLYQQENQKFIDKGQIANFAESSRYIETDDNNIWVSHPYRGIYKITLVDYTVTLYSRKDGLPADLDNHVFKIKNQVVFATSKGIYEYNQSLDKMIPAKRYAALFGDRPVRYLKEDDKGNIWFVQEKTVGVADYSVDKPAIYFIPELKNKILSGFENIYPFNMQNVFVGSEKGFYHINFEKYRQNLQPPKPYIARVQITGSTDSILFGGYSFSQTESRKTISLPYKWNSLRFTYASSFVGPQSTEYSYFLEGFDKHWSTWSTRPEKDYTNLPEGSYTFKIKARTGRSEAGSEESSYKFIVDPPWFRTLWAYFLYATGFSILLYALFEYQKKRLRKKQEERRLADQKEFEEKQRQMAYQHQADLEKSEKELIQLRNKNLEAEIAYKNAELTSSALNLIQKKEFLLKITDELNKINKPDKENIETAKLKKVIRSLTSAEKLDEEWKQFSIHFNQVHSNFLITLKKKFPNLNAHEMKLCAYLRLNLTSKEMARLMSISVRGVEIGRYRLRKKLQLQPKEDLFQFLLNLETSESAGAPDDLV